MLTRERLVLKRENARLSLHVPEEEELNIITRERNAIFMGTANRTEEWITTLPKL